MMNTKCKRDSKTWASLIPFRFALLLLSLSLPTFTVAHPLKLSASLLEYNPEDKTLRMECKVFRDDFERSISTHLKGVDPSTIKREQKKGIIEAYFNKNYIITFNGKTTSLKLKSSQYIADYNVLVFQFEPQKMFLREGSELHIKNTLLFEEFGYAQTNRIAVRIPIFSIKESHEATIVNSQFSYRF